MLNKSTCQAMHKRGHILVAHAQELIAAAKGELLLTGRTRARCWPMF